LWGRVIPISGKKTPMAAGRRQTKGKLLVGRKRVAAERKIKNHYYIEL